MNSNLKSYAVAASLAALVSFAPASFAAGSASADLTVTASVADNCLISTSAVAFGAYDPIGANLSAPKDGTGSVSITCTQGAVTNVELGLGLNGTSRMMDNGVTATKLGYDLFQDAPGGTVWGTTTDALDTGTAPSAALRAFTIYGQIPAGQAVTKGSYADTVVATVNF
ncbi:MAG: spore coat U domain-containing protein [Thermoanaerobaculia bacterium]